MMVVNQGVSRRFPLSMMRRARAAGLIAATLAIGAAPALAQSYAFSNVVVEGNELIEPATIVKFARVPKGTAVSEAGLNDAYQRLIASGLFAKVELVPSGGTLVIRVVENPTINVVDFEGNARLKDEQLAAVIKSQGRRIFSAAQIEADAAAITKAYADAGRLAARVEPRVIDRGNNKVDVVFEIREGKITEVERLSFTGNRSYSDRRLRQVLASKQAGLLRAIIQRDSYAADRIEFDKQLLTDFYRARGFIDFQVLSVAQEYAGDREGFFLTYNVREGLSYRINSVRVVSEYEGVDAAAYEDSVRIRSGVTYSPVAIDSAITRMENIALRDGVNFLSVEPRITRNERNQTLDVVFALTKGPRVFVERIDIQGNATTVDRVVRRQFRTVEGDPFNPREIRQAAERIRALGYFKTADVNARPGTDGDQVIVDVNVEEQPTGSLNFGATYSVSDGFGIAVGLTETNFLGRGQALSFNIAGGVDNKSSGFSFVEPAFLERDLKFRFDLYYNTTDNQDSFYSTKRFGTQIGFEFPVSEFGRLDLHYKASSDEITSVSANSSTILKADEALGAQVTSALGYTYTYDTRIGGLDPNRGVLLRFGQDFAGLGGDITSVTTTALASYQVKAFREEVTLRAEIEGGAVVTSSGDSRFLDRFTGNRKIRGFEPNGIGPRDLTVPNQDALGGNYFAVARLEAEFPLGLPEEYGITGGLFADIGSVWDLDNTLGVPVDDSLKLRSAIGFSIFWTTPIGPLRFNFSRAIAKESYDLEQNFDLTVSTRF
jgi:outer membrane protein insertion porin family